MPKKFRELTDLKGPESQTPDVVQLTLAAIKDKGTQKTRAESFYADAIKSWRILGEARKLSG